MKSLILMMITGLIIVGLNAFPVHIESWKIDEDIKTLNALSVSVDNVNRQTNSISVYVRNDDEFQRVLSSGLAATRLPDLAREKARQIHSGVRDPENAYYSLDEYHQFMQQTAAQYPAICQLVQFGTSGQNRPLYIMKITNSTNQIPKPQFRFMSSIHGNEVVGYDLLIRLIQLLTSQYGVNTRITTMVDNAEIWLNPMFNPDGYVLGQRYNAAGYDLNRNYPMPTGVQHPDGNPWGVENIAFMDFAEDKNFILSGMFHGGALVMNYPWDYTYQLAPDDALLQQISLSYSIHNTQMYNSSSFPNGITNGAAWYVITGSHQDWNYFYTDCIDITIEVGDNMWPPSSTLDNYWQANQESMLSYLENVYKGVRGLVQSTSGQPLTASIQVGSNSKIIKTQAATGFYHRMLLPGTYDITASATGYISQTQPVTIAALNYTTLNFTLQPAQMMAFQGQVRDPAGNPVSNAAITINSDPVINVTTNINGVFNIPSLYEGDYQIQIMASGFGVFSQEVAFRLENDSQVFVLAPPIFTDTFDNGIGNWNVQPAWAVINDNGNYVLTDSPAGSYSNNWNRSATLSPPLNLFGISQPVLSFRAKFELESGYDFVYVEVSNSGSNWTQIESFSGEQSTWQQYTYSLDAFAGQTLHLRFRIRTDSSVISDGIYLDDVVISGANASLNIYGDVNRNGVVELTDAQSVLDYSAWLDPLPEIDPAPWQGQTITLADVNADGDICSMDAWLIQNYLSDPAFRFPVQTGSPYQTPQPAIQYSHSGNRIRITFEEPANLLAFNLDFLEQTGFTVNGLGWGNNAQTGLSASNIQIGTDGFNHFAWLKRDGNFDYIDIDYSSGLPEILLDYRINGISGQLTINLLVENSDQFGAPPVFGLMQNHPNPFNPSTTIRYSLAGGKDAVPVTLRVYNHKGQMVRSLFSGLQNTGTHSMVFDGKDEAGKALSSGVYFYRLISGNQIQTRKMILLK